MNLKAILYRTPHLRCVSVLLNLPLPFNRTKTTYPRRNEECVRTTCGNEKAPQLLRHHLRLNVPVVVFLHALNLIPEF